MNKQTKKQILSKPQSLWIEPPAGLLEETRDELEAILSRPLYPSKFPFEIESKDGILWLRNFEYRSALELMYRLRTARDIWLVIKSLRVGSFKELAKALSQCAWQDYLGVNNLPNIEVKSFQSKLYHEGKIKDMVESHLKEKGFVEGDSQEKIQVHQHGNRLTVSVSLGGLDLYKRGFKKSFTTKAPLAEHIAAGLLQAIKSEDFDEIFVPFAGGGTLGFETLMKLGDIAPVNFRRSFAGESIPASPQATLNFLKTKLLSKEQRFPKITFIDKAPNQVTELKENIDAFQKAMGSAIDHDVLCEDAFQSNLEFCKGKRILLPLNPPYGLRLAHRDSSQSFYASLGEWITKLAESCKELNGFCLCPDAKSYKVMRQILGNAYAETKHINQGGRHVRALYFSV